MTFSQLIDDFILLAGGLGLFLFGMKLMSESIEKSAGARLRSILEFFTKNKFAGIVVGVVFTGIVQSSSACTVMVVSFVNSGLMTLGQAVGVIMGANVGTTITAWMVLFLVPTSVQRLRRSWFLLTFPNMHRYFYLLASS